MKKTLLADIRDYIGIAKEFVSEFYVDDQTDEMLICWDGGFYIQEFGSVKKIVTKNHIKAQIWVFLSNCAHIKYKQQMNVKPNKKLVAEVHDALAAYCSDYYSS